MQADLLGQVADFGAPASRVERLAIEPDGARVRAQDADDTADGGRLPGAIRAEEAEHCPFGD